MPTISIFFGIIVQMYWRDHPPPHFHARYGRARALVRISDGIIMACELPPTARRLVQEWALLRRAELEQNWQEAIANGKLERIAGPDGQG